MAAAAAIAPGVRSLVWTYFNPGTDSATCKQEGCKIVLQVRKKTTGSLRNHLRTKHPQLFAEMVRHEEEKRDGKEKSSGERKRVMRQAEISDYSQHVGFGGATVKEWEDNNPRQQKANLKLVEFIARDCQPISVVEDDGLAGLLAHLQPCYKLPCRKTVTNMIAPEAQRVRLQVKNRLHGGEGEARFLSFTSDIWSDATNKLSFISLSG